MIKALFIYKFTYIKNVSSGSLAEDPDVYAMQIRRSQCPENVVNLRVLSERP